MPVKRVPLFAHEVLGETATGGTGQVLYPGQKIRRPSRERKSPTLSGNTNGAYEIRVLLPFATKGEVGLFKKGDELVVEIGTLRRHIGLPRSMAALLPSRARLDNRVLTVEMKEAQ